MKRTYWNGLPCPAVRGKGVVAHNLRNSKAWYDDLVGMTQRLVRVYAPGGVRHIWDGDGSGWYKVTEGRGSPNVGHTDIEVEPGSFKVLPLEE
jgi:hypothetical protein